MTKSIDKILVQTQVNLTSVIWGTFGVAFFSFMTYLTVRIEVKPNQNTDVELVKKIHYAIIAIFSGFTLFYTVMFAANTKQITLTQTALKINRPFLFFSKTIAVSEILELKEYPHIVNAIVKNINYKVHEGKKAVLYLTNGEKIKFNSFETSSVDYKLLMKALRRIRRK